MRRATLDDTYESPSCCLTFTVQTCKSGTVHKNCQPPCRRFEDGKLKSFASGCEKEQYSVSECALFCLDLRILQKAFGNAAMLFSLDRKYVAFVCCAAIFDRILFVSRKGMPLRATK